MATTKWTKRSPKGLRQITKKETTGMQADRYFKLEPTGRPGEFVSYPNWSLMVRENLKTLRADMLAKGGREGLEAGWENKASAADAPFFASSILQDIGEIEGLLTEMDRRTDADVARRSAYEALQKMFVLMANLESWVLVANENALHTHVGHLDRLKTSNKTKSSKAAGVHAKFQSEADDIWKRNPSLTNKAVADIIIERMKRTNPKKRRL